MYKNDSKIFHYNHTVSFQIPGDGTFLDTDREKKEYVMNEHGVIWRGVHNVMRPTPWIYGQVCINSLPQDFLIQSVISSSWSSNVNQLFLSSLFQLLQSRSLPFYAYLHPSYPL